VDSALPVAIIAALILLNGLFVAAEFAIVGVTRAEIEQAIRQRRKSAELVRTILTDARQQDRFIATAQLGITAASLGLGMYGEHVLAHWIAGWLEGWGIGRWIAAHTVATVTSVAVLTYFHIVVGEMVPKALALQRACTTALWVTPVMRMLQLALYPLVVGLNGLGNLLLRVAGIERGVSAEQYRTPEELAFIVQESQAGGLLRKESADVISELLEFGERTAEEVMVPRVHVVGIPLRASQQHIAATMRATPHARYPVYDDSLDRIVGMVHIKDLLRNAVRDVPLSETQPRAVPFVPHTSGVDTILAAMRASRSQLVVVMDEYGGTAGIVTMEDLFEEVVGDFTEDLREPAELFRDAEGRLHVRGTVRLDDVGEALGVVIEHEEVDTVSGLVLALLDRPPRVGDVVMWEDVRFEVIAVRGLGVEECRVDRVDSPTNER
jgi:CBS domain containing-hemolysin-like protein